MCRNLCKLFLALCLVTVGGGVVANAQIDSGTAVQTNVPFTFMVGDTTLPAGKYEVRGLDDSTPGVLELRSADGRTSVIIDTENVEAKSNQVLNKSELVFDKVGDKYFLSQVWEAGSSSGSQLAKSRMQKKLEGGGMQTERQSIAAVVGHPKR